MSKGTVKQLIAAFISLAVFVILFPLVNALVAQLCGWLFGVTATDPATSRALYYNPLTFGCTFIIVFELALRCERLLKRLIDRYGFFGLLPPATAWSLNCEIDVTLYATETDAVGNTSEKERFAGQMPALNLHNCFHRQMQSTLVSGDTTLRIEAAPSNSKSTKSTKTNSVKVCLQRDSSVLYSFETDSSGQFWSPANETYSYCRFDLTHRGCEAYGGCAIFKGNTEAMRCIFLS